MSTLPASLIQKIREEVAKGKSKRQVAKELNVNRKTVTKYTKDISSRYTHKRYTPEFIEKIRQLTKEIGIKSEVARILGIPYESVIKYTKDIKVRNKTFGQKTWEMLKEIMEKGYVFTNSSKPSTKIYILRKHFPKIQLVVVENRGVAFLPERKEEAMRALLEKMGRRVWSHQKLKRISKLFDAELTKKEKLELVGRRRPMRKKDL